MLSKKYTGCISLLIALVFIAKDSKGCGPALYSDDARFSIFRPDASGMMNLLAFNYTQSILHYYDPEVYLSDRKVNCQEWRSYTGNKASLADIDVIQYETAPAVFIQAYERKNWGVFKDNSFVKWLIRKKNRKALDYFYLAKQAEATQTTDTNDWGEVRYNSDFLRYKEWGHAALQQCGKKQPEFLKMRYAFQAVKMLHYAGLYGNNDTAMLELKDVYQKHLLDKASIVANWALVYYANAQVDPTERNYYLLKAFDQTEEKKVYAFRNMDVTLLKALEQKKTDVGDLVLIRAVEAMKNPGRGLEDMRYIYAKDPQNKYLPLLMTREINKLEDWIWSPEVLGFESEMLERLYFREKEDRGISDDKYYAYYADENLKRDKQYLLEVKAFFQTMLQQGFHKADFTRLCIAHLANMNEDHSGAKQALSQIVSLNDTNLAKQLLIEQFITVSNTENLQNDTTKERLAQIILQLGEEGIGISKVSDEWYSRTETDDDGGELYVYLSRKYKATGDNVVAGLLQQKSGVLVNEYGYTYEDSISYSPIHYFDKYSTPEDVDKILALKHKGNKSSFEKMISPNVWGTDPMYLDLKGTLLTRQMKFKEALHVYESMPDNFWETSYEFKSYLPIASITDLGTLLPVPSGNKKTYIKPSKKLVLQEIVQLQDAIAKAASDKDKAEKQFWLANALFNISYNGSGWMVSAYGQSTTEPYYAEDGYHWVYYYLYPSVTNHVENYYGCEAAMDMYQQALASAKDDKELAAQCLVMLGYCDGIAHAYAVNKPVKGVYSYSEERPVYHSPFLKALVKKYSGTRTFVQAQMSCPDVHSVSQQME